ncbi:UNVERIFIED_CONTAM: hypothetical protein RKD50_000682 [Streptomyces canus]
MAWIAPMRMLAAMKASTGHPGMSRRPSAAAASATECPAVKAGVMRPIRPTAERAPTRPSQRRPRGRVRRGQEQDQQEEGKSR